MLFFSFSQVDFRVCRRYSTLDIHEKSHTAFPIDNKKKSCMYETGFTELCCWLEHLLRDGFLVSLMRVRNKYQEIIELRKETITRGVTRTVRLRERLHRKYEKKILFTKVSNRQSVFIAWNDLSKITQSTLIISLMSEYKCNVGPKKIYKDRGNRDNQDIQGK